jgi:hypothetical protein
MLPIGSERICQAVKEAGVDNTRIYSASSIGLQARLRMERGAARREELRNTLRAEASVYLARLEPGGIREPHWHPPA